MIPRPRVVRQSGRGTSLSDGVVVAADDASAGVASLLAAELEAATGWNIRRGAPGASSPSGVIRLEVRAAPGGDADGLRRESYQLRVTESGVEIVAPSAAGAFYATRTLRQLLPPELLRSAPTGAPAGQGPRRQRVRWNSKASRSKTALASHGGVSIWTWPVTSSQSFLCFG